MNITLSSPTIPFLPGKEDVDVDVCFYFNYLAKVTNLCLHESLENIKNLVSFSFLYISEEMCKVLGIIFLQTEWNGPIVRFLSNSYCVIVFPA